MPIIVKAYDIVVEPVEPSSGSSSDSEEDDGFSFASTKTLEWRITIGIRFFSDDPADWGEFRAFGGSCTWASSIGVKEVITPNNLVVPERIRGLQGQGNLVHGGKLYALSKSLLPVWGEGRPRIVTEFIRDGDDLRIGNDQHMNIWYARPVAGVPRSLSKVPSRHTDAIKWHSGKKNNSKIAPGSNVAFNGLEAYDPFVDINTPWNEKKDVGKNISEEAFLTFNAARKGFHIVVSDEPSGGSVMEGQTVKYWHQAEYWITDPANDSTVWGTRLLLKIEGAYDALRYTALLGDVCKFDQKGKILVMPSRESMERDIHASVRDSILRRNMQDTLM